MGFKWVAERPGYGLGSKRLCSGREARLVAGQRQTIRAKILEDSAVPTKT
jgi:hypothetical protein